MNIAITGTTRGLGKYLFDYYKINNNIIKFNRGDSIRSFIHEINNIDLLINNSYLDGYQNQLFDSTINKVKKMVVMGSIAADNPDPSNPEYSKNKKILQEKIKQFNSNILYLKLTGKSYKNFDSIVSTIDLWINNPVIKSVEFYPYE